MAGPALRRTVRGFPHGSAGQGWDVDTEITLRVDKAAHPLTVDARTTLSDALREGLRNTSPGMRPEVSLFGRRDTLAGFHTKHDLQPPAQVLAAG